MIRVKNFETMSKFVNVMRACLEYCRLFFPDMVYNAFSRCWRITTIPRFSSRLGAYGASILRPPKEIPSYTRGLTAAVSSTPLVIKS